jgi:geranylgeranyl pyrophosphate synthase
VVMGWRRFPSSYRCVQGLGSSPFHTRCDRKPIQGEARCLRPMATDDWPSHAALCSAVARRVEAVLDQTGAGLAAIIRLILAGENRVLSPQPRPHSSLIVTAVCASAGGSWRQSLWPAVAMECAMAAADAFDDIADGEAAALRQQIGTGGMLMGAAGLLALAPGIALRGVEDGLSEHTVVELGRLLSQELGRAADGQARSLMAATATDEVAAYELSAAKSGPLGSLAAGLGARTATDDPHVLSAYAAFGWHVAVFSQLLNDARDSAPGGSREKRDVRAGSRTVPLVFAGSSGAPNDLEGGALVNWEERERERIVAEGGVLAAIALAQAERVRGLAVLDSLAAIGRPVDVLRQFLA